MKFFNSAAEANKGPIAEALRRYLGAKKDKPLLLEIASGSGQHVVHFAREFPFIRFQPSECTEPEINSIRAYVKESGLENILDPLTIDITTPHGAWSNSQFKENSVDYIICINMIHITPLTCTEWLFKNAGSVLKHQGTLFTYGPYAFNGVLTPESNRKFDNSLKSRNSKWGVRDVELLKSFANNNSLQFVTSHALPANNHLLAWTKI